MAFDAGRRNTSCRLGLHRLSSPRSEFGAPSFRGYVDTAPDVDRAAGILYQVDLDSDSIDDDSYGTIGCQQESHWPSGMPL